MIEIKNLANGVAEVFIFGEIGWEVNSGDFARELASIEVEKITARVDSPGGDAYQGISIMNALRGHPATVTAVVEGLAASAASFIVVGGADHVIVRPQAEIMVHDAMAFVGGNAGDMQKMIADLDRISDNIAGIYADKAGGDPADWRESMRAETWYSAEEAVTAGLADVVEDARHPVEARQRVGVFNLSKFKYPGRRAAPVPVNHAPPGQESKESAMDLKNLAQELGMEEGNLRNALTRIVNEQIEVVTNVEVTYPQDVKVVPTGRVKVSPIGEDMPEGLTFTLGDVADGWSAEVNESTGELTVVAPAVSPGEDATFVVTAQGTGAPTEFNVTVTVKSAAEEEDTSPPVEPAPTAGDPASPLETKTVDVDTWNEMKAMAKLGVDAHTEKQAADRAAEVDQWIKDGRISASLRSKAVAAMERDQESARAVYGANPKNSIPRGEIGYGRDDTAGEPNEVPSVEDLRRLSASRRAAK